MLVLFVLKKSDFLLYQHSIKFLPNDKIIPNFPMSDNFLSNLFHFNINKSVLYHSHATGDVTGSAHKYCKSQERIKITQKIKIK